MIFNSLIKPHYKIIFTVCMKEIKISTFFLKNIIIFLDTIFFWSKNNFYFQIWKKNCSNNLRYRYYRKEPCSLDSNLNLFNPQIGTYATLLNRDKSSFVQSTMKHIFLHKCKGRVRFGAADSEPPFGCRTFGRRDYRAPELIFFDLFFCSYVVSVCSSLRSR